MLFDWLPSRTKANTLPVDTHGKSTCCFLKGSLSHSGRFGFLKVNMAFFQLCFYQSKTSSSGGRLYGSDPVCFYFGVVDWCYYVSLVATNKEQSFFGKVLNISETFYFQFIKKKNKKNISDPGKHPHRPTLIPNDSSERGWPAVVPGQPSALSTDRVLEGI